MPHYGRGVFRPNIVIILLQLDCSLHHPQRSQLCTDIAIVGYSITRSSASPTITGQLLQSTLDAYHNPSRYQLSLLPPLDSEYAANGRFKQYFRYIANDVRKVKNDRSVCHADTYELCKQNEPEDEG